MKNERAFVCGVLSSACLFLKRTFSFPDAIAIAKETARRLSMGTSIYPSSVLDLSEAMLAVETHAPSRASLVENADGFAGSSCEKGMDKRMQETLESSFKDLPLPLCRCVPRAQVHHCGRTPSHGPPRGHDRRWSQ